RNRRASSGLQSTSMVIFMASGPFSRQHMAVSRPIALVGRTAFQHSTEGRDMAEGTRSERISISTPDGEFSAYVARPKADKAPAVVVIQEIFGVNQVMRDITDGLAGQGYLAICPDL